MFLRMVPPDYMVASAIPTLLQYYNWTKVITVSGIHDFGRTSISLFDSKATGLSVTKLAIDTYGFVRNVSSALDVSRHQESK